MKLTVLITNWNELENLKKMFPTLKSQTFKDFKILVVDQGSVDGSVEWLRKNKIETVENGRNLGFSGGVNSGLKRIDTPYVAVFNNDMKLDNKCLEYMMNAIEKDSNIAAVQALLVNWEGTEIENAGLKITYSSFIATDKKYTPFVRTDSKGECKEIELVTGGATIFRMSVLNEVGFFDEDFNPAYNEDADLAMRIKDAGYKCAIHTGSLIRHLGGGAYRKLGYEGRLGLHRNRYRLMKKHWTRRQWVSAALWFPLVAGFFILKKPDKSFFQATWEFLTGQLDKKKWIPPAPDKQVEMI